jgi:hypothetical protein
MDIDPWQVWNEKKSVVNLGWGLDHKPLFSVRGGAKKDTICAIFAFDDQDVFVDWSCHYNHLHDQFGTSHPIPQTNTQSVDQVLLLFKPSLLILTNWDHAKSLHQDVKSQHQEVCFLTLLMNLLWALISPYRALIRAYLSGYPAYSAYGSYMSL